MAFACVGPSRLCGSSMITIGRHAWRNSIGAYPFSASVGRWMIRFSLSPVIAAMLTTMICRCDAVAN